VKRQLEIKSVVDQVHAELLERIVAGELPPGARLRQEALAEELGVSRTPLREALARLVSEGLVEFVPNRGATVANRDFGDMEEAWRARLVIEPGAARLAAERREPAVIERMRDTVVRQRSVADDVTASFALNRDFTWRSWLPPGTRTCCSSPSSSGSHGSACRYLRARRATASRCSPGPTITSRSRKPSRPGALRAPSG
jgi:DNA-binding transcriptional regulator YhcF (GntR family)